MLDFTAELVLTHPHHLMVCLVACVPLVVIVLSVRQPQSPVILDTTCHLRVLSLSLTVYHVSLVSSVLEAQAQLLLMNAFLDTTVRAGLLQEVSMRHQQVIIR